MEDVRLIYSSPHGLRLEKMILFNSRVNANQTIWIFTKVPITTRFQKYISMKNTNKNGSSPTNSEYSMPTRIQPDARRIFIRDNNE